MRCTIWRDAAEHVAESLTCGDRVVVRPPRASPPGGGPSTAPGTGAAARRTTPSARAHRARTGAAGRLPGSARCSCGSATRSSSASSGRPRAEAASARSSSPPSVDFVRAALSESASTWRRARIFSASLWASRSARSWAALVLETETSGNTPEHPPRDPTTPLHRSSEAGRAAIEGCYM